MTRSAAVITAAVLAIIANLAASLAPLMLIHCNPAPSPSWPKLLLWNATASAPRGLYLLQSAAPLHVNDLVAVVPPAPLAEFLALRGYLPAGVPLLKYIAALAPQTVCRLADTITIDSRAVATARDRDHLGRWLPVWRGCRTLRAGEVFLLNAAAQDSFDGRYFGPLPATAITARAQPLWLIKEN
jgi:conjugative transfer signal peptidase TraF